MNRKNLIRLGTLIVLIIAAVVLARCSFEPVNGGGTEGWQASFTPATNRSWTLLTGVSRGNMNQRADDRLVVFK